MFLRYEGKVWEERLLTRLTSPQVKRLRKDDALVVLPLGAVEQHGPHLPVMTDALIGEAVLTRAMELLPPDSNIWLLPPVSYGKSIEHLDFAGTFSLSATTLQGVITDIAVSLRKSGFRRLLLFNTHGGNADLCYVAAREVRVQTGLMVFYVSPGGFQASAGLVTDEEQEFGIHGGDIETSLVMAIKPGWVQNGLRVAEMPDMSGFKYLTLESGIRFTWVMSDISESGIAGDATRATPEKGEEMLRRTAASLAAALQEISAFEIETVKRKTQAQTG